jgi:hypothetical protein
MTRNQKESVLATQAEIYSLTSLLRCLRSGVEAGLDDATISGALSSCEDAARDIADRMEKIPGLNNEPEDAA